jgi:hypothetical protein
MNPKVETAAEPPKDGSGSSLLRVHARLKKLRRKRRLVEKAIVALTQMSRTPNKSLPDSRGLNMSRARQ